MLVEFAVAAATHKNPLSHKYFYCRRIVLSTRAAFKRRGRRNSDFSGVVTSSATIAVVRKNPDSLNPRSVRTDFSVWMLRIRSPVG